MAKLTTAQKAKWMADKLETTTRRLAKYDAKFVLSQVSTFYRYGELDRTFDNAVYGIQWTVNTGRLSGTLCIALRDIPAKDMAVLVYDIADQCRTVQDVKDWLQENHSRYGHNCKQYAEVYGLHAIGS